MGALAVGALQGFMGGGKGFVDFANPQSWSGRCHGSLLPEEESRLPVLFRSAAWGGVGPESALISGFVLKPDAYWLWVKINQLIF